MGRGVFTCAGVRAGLSTTYWKVQCREVVQVGFVTRKHLLAIHFTTLHYPERLERAGVWATGGTVRRMQVSVVTETPNPHFIGYGTQGNPVWQYFPS